MDVDKPTNKYNFFDIKLMDKYELPLGNVTSGSFPEMVRNDETVYAIYFSLGHEFLTHKRIVYGVLNFLSDLGGV